METAPHHHTPITHAEKQKLAHELWERADRPNGRDVDFWLEAEQQLIAIRRDAQFPARKAASKPKRAKLISSAKKAGSGKISPKCR